MKKKKDVLDTLVDMTVSEFGKTGMGPNWVRVSRKNGNSTKIQEMNKDAAKDFIQKLGENAKKLGIEVIDRE